MKTIQELEVFLEDNCYNFSLLSIGKHYAPEGDIFKFSEGNYVHSFSERGNERIIEIFDTEKELVEYAYQILENNKWYKAHLVAFVYDVKEIKKAELLLKEMNIQFEHNDIPNYREGERAYRIFVFGKDILKCGTIKKKYINY